MPSRSWQEVAAIAQDHRDRSIAQIKPTVPDVPLNLPTNVTKLPQELLSNAEIAITESSPENLLSSLASGERSSTEVTIAFLRRAGLAQKLVSSILFAYVSLYSARAASKTQWSGSWVLVVAFMRQ